jgi:hypothetical protein
VVEVSQKISADRPVPQTFPARLAQDMIDPEGRVLVPGGSPIELTVVQTSKGGGTSTPQIALAVQSITINGQRDVIDTNVETRSGTEGLGANPRTGAFVGGGAAIGTVLGAFAGGWAGALFGGAMGAASGAAVQVLTQGSRVDVPAGTVINFRLDQDWRLRAEPPPPKRPANGEAVS